MNQHTIRGLSLARVAGHCVAVVQMRVPIGIDLERAAGIHVQTYSSSVVNASDHPQFAVCNFQVGSRLGELNAVANRESSCLLAEDRDAPLSARIVCTLGSVL